MNNSFSASRCKPLKLDYKIFKRGEIFEEFFPLAFLAGHPAPDWLTVTRVYVEQYCSAIENIDELNNAFMTVPDGGIFYIVPPDDWEGPDL